MIVCGAVATVSGVSAVYLALLGIAALIRNAHSAGTGAAGVGLFIAVILGILVVGLVVVAVISGVLCMLLIRKKRRQA